MGDRSVKITGTREDGTTATVKTKFSEGKQKHWLERIRFHRLSSIDLRPLANHSKLENIQLECTSLVSIDLSPLTKCKRLHSFNLKVKELQALDLTPLNNHNLSYLAIQCPDLQSLDLTPISNSTNLRYAFIKADQLKSLNLAPLANSKKLDDLSIACARLQSLDLSPFQKHNFSNLGIESQTLKSVDLQALSNSTNLQSLEILVSRLQKLNRDPVPTEKLLKFRLNNTSMGMFNTSFLNNALKLEEADFAYNALSSIDLSVFAEKEKLRKLDLSYNKLRIVDITPLFTCFALFEVNFRENDDLVAIGFIPLKGQYEAFKTVKEAGLTSEDMENLILKHNRFHRSILRLCDVQIILFPKRNQAEVLLLTKDSFSIKTKAGPCHLCTTTSPPYGAIFPVDGDVWVCADCLRRNYVTVLVDHKLSFQHNPPTRK